MFSEDDLDSPVHSLSPGMVKFLQFPHLQIKVSSGNSVVDYFMVVRTPENLESTWNLKILPGKPGKSGVGMKKFEKHL